MRKLKRQIIICLYEIHYVQSMPVIFSDLFQYFKRNKGNRKISRYTQNDIHIIHTIPTRYPHEYTRHKEGGIYLAGLCGPFHRSTRAARITNNNLFFTHTMCCPAKFNSHACSSLTDLTITHHYKSCRWRHIIATRNPSSRDDWSCIKVRRDGFY